MFTEPGPLLPWREASAELESKNHALREAVAHVARRARETRKIAATLRKSQQRLPIHPNEEGTVCAMWRAVHKSYAGKIDGLAAMADRLDGLKDRLDGQVTSLEESYRLKARGNDLDDELRAATARTELEKERHIRLVQSLTSAREAERSADPGSRKESRLRDEAERLEADASVAEALYKSLYQGLQDLQRLHTAEKLPALLKVRAPLVVFLEYDEAFNARLVELAKTFAEVAEAEAASAEVFGSSAKLFAAAVADVRPASDASEMYAKLNARASVAAEASPRRKSDSGFARRLRRNTFGQRTLERPAWLTPPTHSLQPPQTAVTTASACEMIRRLVDLVGELGGARTEGIFRLAESLAEIDEAADAIERCGRMPTRPNLAATLLKRWLTKKLPEPLVPYAQYDAAIERGEDAVAVFESMPDPNKPTLAHMLRFFRTMAQPENAAVTMMGIRNLLTCIGPCIMRPRTEATDVADAAISTDKISAFLEKLVDSDAIDRCPLPPATPLALAAAVVASAPPSSSTSPFEVPTLPIPILAAASAAVATGPAVADTHKSPRCAYYVGSPGSPKFSSSPSGVASAPESPVGKSTSSPSLRARLFKPLPMLPPSPSSLTPRHGHERTRSATPTILPLQRMATSAPEGLGDDAARLQELLQAQQRDSERSERSARERRESTRFEGLGGSEGSTESDGARAHSLHQPMSLQDEKVSKRRSVTLHQILHGLR
eukprot:m51a1_g9738 hypothetical protein (722) ;mRNA; f:1538203-1541547